MSTKPQSAPFLTILWVILACIWSGQTSASDLSFLVPAAGDLSDWAPVGKSEQFEGLDLYELINGGAEVYHEYGFRRVLAQEYGDEEQRFIALEIYEMDDPAAAFGIYSFRTGPKGEPVSIGTEALLAGHYLNIWKGRFLLTLSGVDPDEATREGLVGIGKAVADRITTSGARPALTRLLPVEPSPPDKVWYLAGDMALANLVSFSGLAPMRFTEGAAGDYGGYSLFLLALNNPDEAADRFASASDRIEAAGHSPLDPTQTEGLQVSRFKNETGEIVHLEWVEKFIVIAVGDVIADFALIRENLLMYLGPVGGD